MKQEVIKISDSNIKWIERTLNDFIAAGFYIKDIIGLDKTTFIVLVEASDLEKCHKKYQEILKPSGGK